MSNQSSSSYSYSSYSYSSSSSTSNSNGQVTGERHVQTSQTDPSGTTVRNASQTLGEPIVAEERRYDAQGNQLLGGAGGMDSSRRIQDVSDEEQAARDREYEERIEDEYAKREGGA